MKQLLDRPQGKIGLGIAVVALLAIIRRGVLCLRRQWRAHVYYWSGDGANVGSDGKWHDLHH